MAPAGFYLYKGVAMAEPKKTGPEGESETTEPQPPEIPKDSERFSRKQYDLLVQSSEKRDRMKDWNAWRDDNPDVEILLRRSPLAGRHLAYANLQGADLWGANLHGAKIWYANLRGANLWCANLQDAEIQEAELQEANLQLANLQEADLWCAHLQGTDFVDADIRGTIFSNAIVDGETLIHTDKVNRETDFSGVGLGNVRMSAGLRQLLEYNMRREAWGEWGGGGSIARKLLWWIAVRPFAWLVDYGRSMIRIPFVFLGLAIFFALLYWSCEGLVLVSVGDKPGQLQNFWHAFYFSIVTMTTLGFGDIHANPSSWFGQTLLILQVVLGYIMLGAIVTRFAVFFTATGPTQDFYKEPKEPGKTG